MDDSTLAKAIELKKEIEMMRQSVHRMSTAIDIAFRSSAGYTVEVIRPGAQDYRADWGWQEELYDTLYKTALAEYSTRLEMLIDQYEKL